MVDAVGDDAIVLVDGGIRSGLDVVKMLSLGAQACLVGRPWAWGVAANGQEGVTHVIEILRQEMLVALGLIGVAAVEDLDPSALVGGT